MMQEGNDATWLFERYKRSEQWWTSLASMLFIHLAVNGNSLPIPIWRFETNQDGWHYYRTPDVLTLADIRPSEVMVEATLKKDLFPDLQSWPTELVTTPDIILYWKKSRRLIIIENKTERAQVGSISKYWKAAKYLKTHGWETDLLLLISCGHPSNSIWNVVATYQVDLLLWEDLLKVADSMDWSRSLFDEDLKRYYECPLLNGERKPG